MVNFRHRSKGKGKRWKKGHSSSSNPEIKQHRNVANSRFFQEHPGKLMKFTCDDVAHRCVPKVHS
jgi:ribosomal RNA-processing protein 12